MIKLLTGIPILLLFIISIIVLLCYYIEDIVEAEDYTYLFFFLLGIFTILGLLVYVLL